MTPVFVDTSALLALLVQGDTNHEAARRAFAGLQARHAALVTTSFVLVETYALIGRRLGFEAVERFRAAFAPLLDVMWVDEGLHEAGLDLLLDRRLRHLSLVDAVSFVAMRRRQISEAFAFDAHFGQQGVVLVQ